MPRNRIYTELVVRLGRGGDSEAAAEREIRAALNQANGIVSAAAADLGVARRTLTRILADRPNLKAHASKLREKAGITGPR